mgnify:CR=1 FL=1
MKRGIRTLRIRMSCTPRAIVRRWRDKDLAALYFSALDIGLTRRDLLRFVREYFPGPLRTTLEAERVVLDRLGAEARRLERRYLRKYAPRQQARDVR